MRDFYKDLKSKTKQFNIKFIDFLKNVFILFKQNFKEVSLFIIGCAFFTLMLTSLLKSILLSLMMRVSGTTYISPINLKDVLFHPGSILLILIFIILTTYMALFEIAGLLHAFSMSQVGRDTTISSMIFAGVRTCKKTTNPKNWAVILYIVVLLPLTKVLPLSSSTFKLVLPGFVNQTIDYTRLYSIL